MPRLPDFIKKRLNTWEEICLDEDIRLRNNTIVFTFAIFSFSVVMLVVDIITHKLDMIAFTIAYFIVSFLLFFIQFNSPKYKVWLAHLVGIGALVLCWFFLYSGGIGGYGFLWLFVVPIMGGMLHRLYSGLLFNLCTVAFVAILLNTPLQQYLLYIYPAVFRVMFPAALAMVSMCVYIGELMRSRIQQRLIETTKELQAFAFTDPLTRAYNRHALQNHFGSLQNNAYGLSFAMLDLDYFKKVNDDHGHLTGDKMLRHVVEVIQQQIPPGALLYRWGGEEFLLILKTRDYKKVESGLQKIRSQIEASCFAVKGQQVPITVSIGAAYPGKNSSIQAAIQQADACLYQAKQNGRNQVVAAHM